MLALCGASGTTRLFVCGRDVSIMAACRGGATRGARRVLTVASPDGARAMESAYRPWWEDGQVWAQNRAAECQIMQSAGGSRSTESLEARPWAAPQRRTEHRGRLTRCTARLNPQERLPAAKAWKARSRSATASSQSQLPCDRNPGQLLPDRAAAAQVGACEKVAADHFGSARDRSAKR